MNEVRTIGVTSVRALLRAVYDYAAFYGSMLLFGALCLSWSLLTLPLYALLPHRTATAWGRYGIMAGFRLYSHWLGLLGVYRLDVSALDALRGGPALILAANHPSLIDAPLILARHPNLTCVMRSDLTGSLLFGPGARLARYIRNGSALPMVREAVANLRDGAVLLLFPEGTRTTRPPVNRLKRSIGVIAKHARVPVQTLIIDTDSPLLRKGWRFGMRPSLPISYRVRLGRRFDPSPDVNAFVAELERYYRSELQTSPCR
ncbi:MAG TPA: lysophospholipid acyltransferase family protein [Steroidobacteraceae bacterium]|nr:lysophospholipid acyltransferase family protein [Steroidobacteraceae bacterium]